MSTNGGYVCHFTNCFYSRPILNKKDLIEKGLGIFVWLQTQCQNRTSWKCVLCQLLHWPLPPREFLGVLRSEVRSWDFSLGVDHKIPEFIKLIICVIHRVVFVESSRSDVLENLKHDFVLIFRESEIEIFHTLIIHENHPSGGYRVPVRQLDFKLDFFQLE